MMPSNRPAQDSTVHSNFAAKLLQPNRMFAETGTP
jgi:hypothetical protein